MSNIELFEPGTSPRAIIERVGAHSYLLILALLTGGPYFLMISISLMGQGWDPVIPPKVLPAEPSLINYIKIWEGTSSLVSHGFSLYLKNTLIYAVGATAVVLLVDSLAGYAFARLEFAGRDIAFGAILATLMISPMVLFIPVYLLFSEFGLINTYIGIILPHTISGFGVFLMRQFIKTLPSSIEDAALIDGCSKFGVYWRIVLPMMKPALATLGIITFIVTWNSFLWPLILARDSSLYSLTVALGYFQAQGNTLWSQLMAATTFTMLPVVIIFVSLQKHYVRGFVISGTKG